MMSEPIRVLHFADLHIGMENYGRLDPATGTSSRVRDFLDRLDEVLEYAIENDADLVIFAGDAFKNRDPEPTQKREFAKRIKRLANEIPTLLLVGNHDMPGMASKANSLDIFRALEVPGVIVGYKAEGTVIETKRGPLYLAWMPYPMRNRLLSREELQGKTIEQLEIALREEVSGILQSLAMEAINHEMPRILAGHFSVAEAEFGSERSVMLGKELALHKSGVADQAWDYIALGHIHKHQDLNPDGYPPVVYSGSLERIDFGEEDDEKGFCWIELSKGGTAWKFVRLAARPFRTVAIDARDEENPTEFVLRALKEPDLEGAVVRVVVRLHAEQETFFHDHEIVAALGEAESVAVVREVEQDARIRLGELSPEALTPLELIEHYLQTRQIDPDRIHDLLSKAEELLY